MAVPCLEIRFRTKREEHPVAVPNNEPVAFFKRKATGLIDVSELKKPEIDPFADKFGTIEREVVARVLISRTRNHKTMSIDGDRTELLHAALFLIDNLPPTNAMPYTFGLRNPEIRVRMDQTYERKSDSLHCAGDLLFVRTADGSYRIREYEEASLIAIATLRLLGYDAKLSCLNVASTRLVTDSISQGRAPAIAVINPFRGCSLATFSLSFIHPRINSVEIYSDNAAVSYLYTNAARNKLIKLKAGEGKQSREDTMNAIYDICNLFRKAIDIDPIAPWIQIFMKDLVAFKFNKDIKDALAREMELMQANIPTEAIRIIGIPGSMPS